MALMGLHLLEEGALYLQTKVPATEQVGFIHQEWPFFLIHAKTLDRLVLALIFPHQFLSFLFLLSPETLEKQLHPSSLRPLVALLTSPLPSDSSGKNPKIQGYPPSWEGKRMERD